MVVAPTIFILQKKVDITPTQLPKIFGTKLLNLASFLRRFIPTAKAGGFHGAFSVNTTLEGI
jgi:hypothetical protein